MEFSTHAAVVFRSILHTICFGLFEQSDLVLDNYSVEQTRHKCQQMWTGQASVKQSCIIILRQQTSQAILDLILPSDPSSLSSNLSSHTTSTYVNLLTLYDTGNSYSYVLTTLSRFKTRKIRSVEIFEVFAKLTASNSRTVQSQSNTQNSMIGRNSIWISLQEQNRRNIDMIILK